MERVLRIVSVARMGSQWSTERDSWGLWMRGDVAVVTQRPKSGFGARLRRHSYTYSKGKEGIWENVTPI